MERRCISCQREIDSPVCPHCGYPVQPQNESHQLPVGTMLRNRYQVGKVLGQGGFGITYLGYDTLMETVVAIKEFYPGGMVNRRSEQSTLVECLTEKMDRHYQLSKERFLREAKALVKFRGVPEVVDLLDFVEENNTAYIVMEYVRGVDLARYIQGRGGRLSVDETFRILRPVMEALATVHKGDIVHRDISPDNIILDPMGGAKLLDFGAVRTVEDPDQEKGLAKSTEAILKHGFAPIEQYNTRGALGPWTDEYAMCATIWYCLTGTIPEEASIRVSEGVDPDWRSIPGLTEQQCAALEKGISVRAKDRFPSMDGLIAALFGEPGPVYQTAPQPEYHHQPQQPVFARTEAINPSGYSQQPAAQYVQPSGQYMPPSGQYTQPSAQQVPPSAQPYTPPAKPVKEKKGKKWGVFAAIAAVLVVAILAGILLPGLMGGNDRVSAKPENSDELPQTEPATYPATEDTRPAEVPVENPLAGTYEVELWAGEALHDQLKAQVGDFEALYGIEIELSLGIAETNDTSSLILNGAHAPDMYFYYSIDTASLVLAGALEGPTGAMEERIRTSNDPASVASASDNGTLYAYPSASNNGYFLYYDTSIISEEDAKSLEAIINACEENGVYFRVDLDNGWYIPSFFFATGCYSFWTMDEAGDFTAVHDTFNSPEGLTAMKAMRKLAQSPCYGPVWNYGFENAGAIITGIWDAGNAADHFGANLGVAALPSFEVDGTSYQMSSFSGHILLGVTPQEDDKRAQVLALLAEYLTSEECQLERYCEGAQSSGTPWIPSNLAAQSSGAVQADPAVAALLKQMQYAIPQGAIHGPWWDICKNLGVAAQQARSDQDLQRALDNYAAAIESLF